MPSSSPYCPCCTFLQNQNDLFLPENTGNGIETTCPIIKSQSTSNNNADGGNNNNNNENDVLHPREALHRIAKLHHSEKQKSNNNNTVNRTFLIVDTHGHAHLERESDRAYQVRVDDNEEKAVVFSDNNDHVEKSHEDNIVPFVSLSCSVEQSDWDVAINYATKSDSNLFGIGIHPWYITDDLKNNNHNTTPDNTTAATSTTTTTGRPASSSSTNNSSAVAWIDKMRHILLQHPLAIVGEIGLCKMAKFLRNHPDGKSAALELQRRVFLDQFALAGELRRPVSVHCVQQHGVMLNMFREFMTTTSPSSSSSVPQQQQRLRILPPAIAMHSFTGKATQVKDLLKLEQQILPPPTEQQQRPPLFYFGFSHVVNHRMCSSEKARRQGRETVRAVPINRILVESDVHRASNVLVGTAGAIAYIAWAIEKPIEEVAEITARNGLRFLTSHVTDKKTTTTKI